MKRVIFGSVIVNSLPALIWSKKRGMTEPLKKVLSKVILLGDMNVGKTTLLNNYTAVKVAAKATIGPDFKKKDI
jgi:GTPase SAR1 family protein